MKNSFASRAVALVVSVCLTFGVVKAIADYAYPSAQTMQLASAAH